MKRFDMVRKERKERVGGGVAIFINNKLKCSHKDDVYDGHGKVGMWPIKLHGMSRIR
jgi:hypothetical protein